MAAFGKFQNVLNLDHREKAISYAIVENGNIIATDGFVLCVVPLDSWVDDIQGFSEGKAFDFHLLNMMASEEFERIEFTEKTVKFFKINNFSDKPNSELFYSGIKIGNTKTYDLIDSFGAKMTTRIVFPDWEKLIPNKFDKKVSDLMVNPEFLNNLYDCFNTESGVKLIFGKEKPIKVVPIIKGIPDENFGYGVIMPIEFK